MEGGEAIENCEVVSFGHGTRLTKMENLNSDGTVVEDCTGDSLALRGFRRYLIAQLGACVKKEPSVYQSTDKKQFTIRDGVQFIFYSTNCPNGDCRTFTTFHGGRRLPKPKKTKDGVTEAAQESPGQGGAAEGESKEAGGEGDGPVTVEEKSSAGTSAGEPATGEDGAKKDAKPGTRANKRGGVSPHLYRDRRRVRNFDGKITFAKKDDTEGSKETISLYDEATSHCIVSPSDKLAMRNICGVQGSLISELSSPVFFQHYLITFNKYNLKELKKSLYDRVQGAEVKSTPPAPEVRGVKWRPTEFLPKTSVFACVWAQGFPLETIYCCEGKQFDGVNVENVDWTQTLDPALFTPSSYCTLQLFKEYQEFCAKHSIPCARKYSDIKLKSSGDYQTVKAAVKKHLEQTGMGSWRDRKAPEF